MLVLQMMFVLKVKICCAVIIWNPLPHSYLKDPEIGTWVSQRNILRFYRTTVAKREPSFINYRLLYSVQLSRFLKTVTYCSNVFAISWAALDWSCFVKVFLFKSGGGCEVFTWMWGCWEAVSKNSRVEGGWVQQWKLLSALGFLHCEIALHKCRKAEQQRQLGWG